MYLIAVLALLLQGDPSIPDDIPVLFIHGFWSGSDTWQDVVKALKQKQIPFGGNFDFRDPRKTEVRNGHYYTLDFSSNRDLGLKEQADQVAKAVEAIRTLTGRSKVLLVGHSMGGLAARGYVVYHSRDDVAGLVSIGTPHAGTLLAFASSYLKENPEDGWAKFVGSDLNLLGFDFDSRALQDLKPDSEALSDLNRRELPRNIRYVDVLGQADRNAFRQRQIHKLMGWSCDKFFSVYSREYVQRCESVLSMFDEATLKESSDGVVPVMSQSLASVRSMEGYAHTELSVKALHTEQTEKVSAIFKAIQWAVRPIESSPLRENSARIILEKPAVGSEVVGETSVMFRIQVEYSVAHESILELGIADQGSVLTRDSVRVRGRGRATLRARTCPGDCRRPFTLVILLLKDNGTGAFEILDEKRLIWD